MKWILASIVLLCSACATHSPREDAEPSLSGVTLNVVAVEKKEDEFLSHWNFYCRLVNGTDATLWYMGFDPGMPVRLVERYEEAKWSDGVFNYASCASMPLEPYPIPLAPSEEHLLIAFGRGEPEGLVRLRVPVFAASDNSVSSVGFYEHPIDWVSTGEVEMSNLDIASEELIAEFYRGSVAVSKQLKEAASKE